MSVSTLFSGPRFLTHNKWLFAVLVLLTANLVLYYAVSVHVRSSTHGIVHPSQIANNAASTSKELSSRSERAGLNVQTEAGSEQPQINPKTNSGRF